MTLQYLILFLLPLLLTYLITPWVIKFANKIGAVDIPGGRKIHETKTTRLGGLAVFISICCSVLISFFLFPELSSNVLNSPVQVWITVFCFITIFLLGFVDDIRTLGTGVKFSVQLLVAILIYYAGFKISNITNPIGVGVLSVEFIDFPLTVLWIIGIINAFNLIDGLDGLASGIALIACTAIFSVSMYSGYMLPAILSLIIAGAMLGFLQYNFHPAKIFLGDSGSLLIGFCLALLSIESATKVSTGFAIFFPLLVLALPIIDTLISMLRRFLGSYLNNSPANQPSSLPRRIYGMFVPDKSHIHHQLLSHGLTHRNTVIVLYMISGFFAAGAFSYTQVQSVEMLFNISLAIGLVLFIGIKKLKYYEIAIFNNGLVLSLFNKWILNRSVVIKVADLVFITTACGLSYALLSQFDPESTEQLNFAGTLLIIVPIQFVTFLIAGIYKEKMDNFSIGKSLHIMACVGYAVLVSGYINVVIQQIPISNLLKFVILDFYLLITFVLGLRIAYQLFNFLYNRHKKSGEQILIYGSGINGEMILQRLQQSPENSVKVVGFLDDDRELKGKIVYGYPILGGHWELETTRLKKTIDTIYICEDSMKPENLRRLKNTACKNNIVLKKLRLSFQEMENEQEEEMETETSKEIPEMTGTTVSVS